MEQNYFHPIITLLLAFVSLLVIFLLVLFYRHRSQFIGNNLPPGQVGYRNENKLVKVWFPSSVDKIFPSSPKTSSVEEGSKMRKMLPNLRM
ncbi:hypothetical protein M0R45_034389 [Rubus argutus]|uniref:ATP synthase F0 subunit 8 n=1 Tax=Rubus argutus TaxID=59490 RepID=A0AAW1VQU3_RUBAR